MVPHAEVSLVSDDANVASGCLLLGLTGDVAPAEVLAKLRSLDGLRNLDAVRGAWDLLASVQASSAEALEALAARAADLPGIATSELRRLTSGGAAATSTSEEPPEGPGPATLYALVESTPDKIDGVLARLRNLDEVKDVAVERDGARVIARVQARTFERIRTVLSDRVRYLDGVLRIEELVVVSM